MNKLIHLHGVKTGGKSLQDAFRRSLANQSLILYRQKDPESAEKEFDNRMWRVISGHIFSPPKSLETKLVGLPYWFTVVRDPAERIISFRNFAFRNPQSGWHDRIKSTSFHEGIKNLVEANTHYAYSSQCRSITRGLARPTLEGAISEIRNRFLLCGAIEQMPLLFDTLKQFKLVKKEISLPHVNRSSSASDDDYLYARSLLEVRCAEDFRLHSWLMHNGPVISP